MALPGFVQFALGTVRRRRQSYTEKEPVMGCYEAGPTLKQLEEHGHECAIAVPVWHELTFGCQRLPRGKRRDAIETYLRDVVLASFAVLAYDEDAAHWHGIERARLDGLGKSAPYVDGQIAAIAYVNELKLVTANVKDFTRFKGVEVENWSKRRG